MYLLLRYFIKNQSTGAAQGILLNLFWIFEYITARLFGGPLSANCPDVKKVVMSILNFEQKIGPKM